MEDKNNYQIFMSKIDKDLYREFKSIAVLKGMKLNDLIQQLIKEFVEAEKK